MKRLNEVDAWADAHQDATCRCGHKGYLHDDGLVACVSCGCRDFIPRQQEPSSDTTPVEYAAFRFKVRCPFLCGIAIWYNPVGRELAAETMKAHATLCRVTQETRV